MPLVKKYKIDIDKFMFDFRLNGKMLSDETGLNYDTVNKIVRNKSLTINSLAIIEKHYGKLDKYL